MRLAERIDPWTPPVTRVVDAAHPAGARPQGVEHPVGHRLVHAGDRAGHPVDDAHRQGGQPADVVVASWRPGLDEQLDEVVDATLRPVLVRAEGQVLDDEGEHEPDDGAGDRR